MPHRWGLRDDMASVAEQLNNAIHPLATLNPRTAAAANLNANWQTWFEKPRRHTCDAALLGIVEVRPARIRRRAHCIADVE